MIKLAAILITSIIFNTDLIINTDEKNLEWQLSKSENQICIYTRQVDYSDYKEFKGEMIVNSNPDFIVSFLQNINAFKEWLPDCLESKKLIQINDTDQINYILTDVPWPFEDRDIVYKFAIINVSQEQNTITILIDNLPKYIPMNESIVRIPKSKGFWTITPIKENLTKVEYQMHVEPGGFVPAWLANLKLVDTPFSFLYNLREQIEKD
jgi:ribosome-associated toxin RatA of RatAB toxin-antitoxin module